MRDPRREIRTTTRAELSAYMRSLAIKRWKKYRLRVARGEITAANYVYRPRGPMAPQSKAKQDLTRWEDQLASARLLRAALNGEKLSKRQLTRMTEETLSRKKRRLHLRFGGKPPKQWQKTSALNLGSEYK
jgi:hypothetical protein